MILVLVASALAQTSYPAVQTDGGIFGVKQFNGTDWATSLIGAWMNAHDYDPPGPPPVEHHEHWYFITGIWNPNNQKRRFIFHGPPQAHDTRPVSTGFTHVLYVWEYFSPVSAVPPPPNSAPTTCTGDRFLCPDRFYTISHTDGGPVTGRVNVYDEGTPVVTRENYTLQQGAWKRASGANCIVDWYLVSYDTGLIDPPGPPNIAPINRVADGTTGHDRNWARTVVSTPPGPNVETPTAPPCPP